MQNDSVNRCQIILFRHGETDWNKEERWQGSRDIPLNETGKEQAKALAIQLADVTIDCILSSDLQRAHDTAKIVAEDRKIPIVTTPSLRELHGGNFEGLTYKEIKEQFGQEIIDKFRSIKKSDMHVSFPGGETKVAAFERIRQGIENFILDNSHAAIGISAHGGVIRLLVHSCLSDESEPIPIPNCIVYMLSFDRDSKSFQFRSEITVPIFSPS
jgi:broad specificity phosphatase PhoE